MIYRLHHATTYDYAKAVVLGTHFMHLLPRDRPGQSIREAELSVSPQPETRRDETDHFGNTTTTVSLTGPHRQFVVALSATVDVEQPAPPPPAQTPRWEAIAVRGLKDPPGRTILTGLLELNLRIWTDMTYTSGVTNNSTTAAQVFKTRAGVCQDYAHFMLACLRSLGLPGRYVSGYLRTSPPAGQTKRRGADQSHAWVSAWLGQDIGWVDFDPTNNLLVSNEHVTLAWGRNFQDVSPLRGIILGGGRHTLRVNVDLDPVLT